MLKVLIVDDEILVRMGLKSTVDWEELGFKIVGEAENGEKALELCRKHKPDVIITDIRMPKMDGITLMKTIRQENPTVKFIVLSCYNEIDIVREAMQFHGALDYIPKLSMLPEDLAKTMNNVRTIIEGERSKEGEVVELKFRGSSKEVEENTILNELIDWPDCDENNIAERLGKTGMELEADSQFVVVCGVMDYFISFMDGHLSSNQKQNKYLILKAIKNCIKKYGFEGYAFYRNNERFGIILTFNEAVTETIYEPIKLMCSDILEECRNSYEVSISFGASRIVRNLSNIKQAYLEASLCADFRLYNGEGSINLYFEYASYNNNNYFGSGEEKLLREYVENGEKQRAVNLILRVLKNISENGRVLPEKAYEQCREMVFTLSSIIKQYSGNMQDLKDSNGAELYKGLSYCESLTEISEWFCSFTDEYFNYLTSLKKQKFGIDISKALDFINLHYAEDIKLAAVAQHISLNETYLSHLFKKATSVSFTEYLNIVRINKSKEYLKNKDLSIYMVAEKVGYSNESYFSKVFKQITGQTPNEYKKQK